MYYHFPPTLSLSPSHFILSLLNLASAAVGHLENKQKKLLSQFAIDLKSFLFGYLFIIYEKKKNKIITY